MHDRTGGPGETRDRAGDQRDKTATERDRAGAARDAAADERDREAEASEAQRRFRSSKGVRRSARARREAAADRAGASGDRVDANADRGASARDRQDASVDTLTGVSCRAAGFLGLDREIARAARSGQPLLVGFIDVDSLKAVNDARGHAAGDQLLVEVADTLRARLRAYDLVFRYGGDEFVCVLAGVDAAFGDARMALVNGTLAGGTVPASVTAGFAQLRPGDSSADVVARADAALYRERGKLPGH